MGQINNVLALAQIMAWRRPGDKPLSEAMMVIGIDTKIEVTDDLGSSPQAEGEARRLRWASHVVGDTTMTEVEVSISILSWCLKAC